MRVMHFISSRGLGRGEVYIDLVNALCEDIEIVLLIPKGALYKNRINRKIETIEYNMPNTRNNPLLWCELWWKIKVAKPDIVHTHFVKASQLFSRVNSVLHLPHVATKHNPRKGKIFNTLPHVIAVSKGVKESIDNTHVTVIYNGVKPVEVSTQKKYDTFTLLAVGRLDKIKGFDVLIKACSELTFAFELLIVGEGEERKALEKCILSYGLEDKVKLLGFQTDIPQRMKNADAVVMNSHSEGFSLVMVESLFYANVFVSTKVSGATEVLEERFLFERDALVETLTDLHHNYTSYQKAYTTLKEKTQDRFLLSKISQEHRALYQQIATRSAR